MERPVALDRHPNPTTCLGEIIPGRQMLHAAVVPERERILAPSEAALKFWVSAMLVEEVQEGIAFRSLQADDVVGETAVNVNAFAAGVGVGADNRMFGSLIFAALGAPDLLVAPYVHLAGVHGDHRVEYRLHIFRQGIVGGVHAREQGVAAYIGYLGEMKQRSHRRFGVATHVGVPAGTFRERGGAVGVDLHEFGAAIYTRRGRVDVQLAEALADGYMLIWGEFLVPEKNNQMLHESTMHNLITLVVQGLAQVDSVDFGADMAGQWLDSDIVVAHGCFPREPLGPW